MQKLSDQVYQSIKKDILKHELVPGDRVIEGDLAHRYGVSRTPIREALKRLSQDGFVKPYPNHGYTVATITVRDVQEVFKLRIMLEGEAVALATPLISESNLNQLRDTLTKNLEMTQSDNSLSPIDYLASNNEFHLNVARASGNLHLVKIISHLLDESNRIIHAKINVVGKKGIEESLGVIEAMRSRDTTLASQSMQEHIQAVYDRIMNAIWAGGIPGICC
jgi:DNA-binding GntR family transcriptional regulator